MTDTYDEHLNEFQQIIDVKFLDPSLLRRALTHRSFVNEVDDDIRDNERLEFLGDAVLDFIVADMLFRQYPDVAEGELTQLRAALVRADSLALLASQLQLGDYLFIGKGEENSGGRTRVNNLCRGFEAVLGALYIDQGADAVARFVTPQLQALLAYIIEHDLHKDARSMLQERSQAELRFTPIYRLVDSAGPDHEREFLIEVVVGRVVIGQGVGASKRSAAQAAARAALKRLEEVGWPEEPIELPEEPDQPEAEPETPSDESQEQSATKPEKERKPRRRRRRRGKSNYSSSGKRKPRKSD